MCRSTGGRARHTGNLHVAPGSEAKDLDGDLDADLSDFGTVQLCYVGEGIVADVACDDG